MLGSYKIIADYIERTNAANNTKGGTAAKLNNLNMSYNKTILDNLSIKVNKIFKNVENIAKTKMEKVLDEKNHVKFHNKKPDA